MKKIILIPDSFKGTMSSETVCRIMSGVLQAHFPDAELVSIPVADGGEGSVDCFLCALGGKKKYVQVHGVFGEPMQSYYGVLPGGKTAVVELAACAGLPLAKDRMDPGKATTYGVGELLLVAAEDGVEQIILGLGGSATNDGGCGAAAAAGVVFRNKDGRSFVPTGDTLAEIDRIDCSGLNPLLRKLSITAMCDVDSPPFGETGAAYIFAPQKGADREAVIRLDQGLRHLCKKLAEELGTDVSGLPGGGAAGGAGAGMHAFFHAQLKPGIVTILDLTNFDFCLTGTDLVLTGEGQIDGQSLRGKVVAGVARRAAKQQIPVVAVVGSLADGAEEIYEQGVTAMFSINTKAMDFSQSRWESEKNLKITMENLSRLLSAGFQHTGRTAKGKER